MGDQKETHKEDEKLTLILGLKYNLGNGAIMMTDSMYANADGSLTKQKLYYQFEKSSMISGSGTGPILDMIEERFGVKLNNSEKKIDGFRDMLDVYEDTVLEIKKRYSKFLECDENKTLIHAMMAFWNNVKHVPEIYTVNDNSCIAVRVEQFEAIGSGQEVALNILNEHWNESMTKEQCMKLGAYCVGKASQYVLTVNSPIQIGVIEFGKVKVLNYDDNDNFTMEPLDSKLLFDEVDKVLTKEKRDVKKWLGIKDESYSIVPLR